MSAGPLHFFSTPLARFGANGYTRGVVAPARPPYFFRFAAVTWMFVSLTVATASPWFSLSWRVDDGLPGDNVTGVAQTSDGYLWIATQTGLSRFDGVRFQNIPIPLGRTYPIIRAMLLDRSEQLWLAEEGGVLIRRSPAGSTMLTTTNGLSKAQALEIVQGSDQSVWISYVDGSVCRVTGDAVVSIGENEGLPAAGACSLALDARRQLWFAKSGQVGVLRGERFVPLVTPGERFTQIQGARGGGVWICAADKLMKYTPDGSLTELGKLPAESTPVRPTAIFEDRRGRLWIGTSTSGLFCREGTNISSVATSHGRIRTVTEDHEGNIWVGTDGGGLNRIRRQVVELQGKEDGLPFDTVRSVCEDASGGLWIVTQNGEVANRTDDHWHVVSAAEAWPGGQATSVVGDTNGVVWIGTYLRGLYRWENGQFTVLRRRDGLAASSIRSMLLDRAGNLWIAYSTGDILQKYHAGQFQNYDLPPDSRTIRTMTEDVNGNIWMANLDAQLLRVDGNRVVDETALTAEPHRPIRCLAGSSDGSLWIGYSAAGLGRLKAGKFTRIDREQGLLDNSICSMIPDDRGWMWFGSDHGIFRARQTELENVSDGLALALKAVGYGRDDGLPSLQGYYGYAPGAARTRDGRILIPTHSGLAIAYPDQIRTNQIAPPVVIESAMVDNQRLLSAPKSGRQLLPPGHRKLEVTFTAPSFIEPEKVRFRYRLEGWDENWVEAGDLRSAVYSRLPAGQYKFRVMAGNNADVWNDTGAMLGFVVMPFFWQTWWFRLLMVFGFTTIIVAVARYVSFRRLQWRVRRLESENALQKERARIAQDIHDDLGARMTQISLLAELTEQTIARPEQAGNHVRQIATMSRQGIKALDEIVWAVNPGNDTLHDLLDYAGQYAVDYLQTAGVRCRVDFPNEPPPHDLPADVRHGLFLAVKEALHNIVKHAQATEVWLRVHATDKMLAWEISDDGRGFASGPDNAQADGLRNMRERLAEMGGVCSIDSTPGGGTKIRFEVPWRRHD